MKDPEKVKEEEESPSKDCILAARDKDEDDPDLLYALDDLLPTVSPHLQFNGLVGFSVPITAPAP